MLRAPLVLLVAALSGCAAAPSCYFGVTLFVPLPVVMCGADLFHPDPEDLDV